MVGIFWKQKLLEAAAVDKMNRLVRASIDYAVICDIVCISANELPTPNFIIVPVALTAKLLISFLHFNF